MPYGWDTAPRESVAFVRRLTEKIGACLGENLVGVYLHGSLAMGCFNPIRSDLDLLMVTRAGLLVEEKRQMASLLLRQSMQPFPVEISFLRLDDLTPWVFPPPFEFHYSEMWRDQIRRQLASGEWVKWNDRRQTDPDLAAHVTVMRHRGIVLRGAPIEEVFPVVPDSDYVAAIWENDGKDVRQWVQEKPVYGILNLCRILAYLTTGQIQSKAEGGNWGVASLPMPYRDLVQDALDVYRGDLPEHELRGEALKPFAAYMTSQIERHRTSAGPPASPTAPGKRRAIIMDDKQYVAPDSTAVRVALWRALHVQVDPRPHVLEDEIGLRLVAPEDDWRRRPDMDAQFTTYFRASIVARARFVEDLVTEQARNGVTQYVILGAGLDTFAQRRPEIASRMRVFEVDQPGTQAWKRQRLTELGFGIPEWLRLVPVDFEAGWSWWEQLKTAGFDASRPAVVASTGVTQYLTRDAVLATLRQAATLPAGSTLAMTFILPLELTDPELRPGFAASLEGARSSGTPFISLFTPQEMLALACEAGFKETRHLSAADLTQRYFTGRTDALWVPRGEEFLVATTSGRDS